MILNNNLKAMDALNTHEDLRSNYWLASINMSYHTDMQKSSELFVTQRLEFYYSIFEAFANSAQGHQSSIGGPVRLFDSKNKSKKILTYPSY